MVSPTEMRDKEKRIREILARAESLIGGVAKVPDEAEWAEFLALVCGEWKTHVMREAVSHFSSEDLAIAKRLFPKA